MIDYCTTRYMRRRWYDYLALVLVNGGLVYLAVVLMMFAFR